MCLIVFVVLVLQLWSAVAFICTFCLFFGIFSMSFIATFGFTVAQAERMFHGLMSSPSILWKCQDFYLPLWEHKFNEAESWWVPQGWYGVNTFNKTVLPEIFITLKNSHKEYEYSACKIFLKTLLLSQLFLSLCMFHRRFCMLFFLERPKTGCPLVLRDCG